MVVPVPEQLHRIQADDELLIGDHRWRVIIGQGHSPQHACLYCEDLQLLISGDQVLPKISPHIGVYPTEPDGNPLGLYLQSLQAFNALPENTLVLPSHNDPFVGLHPRVQALREHHYIRLDRLLTACQQPATANELVPAMFTRPLSSADWSLALAETTAHLHALMASGKVTRILQQDGCYHFQQAA